MTRLLLDLCLVYMGHRIKVHLQSSPKVGFLCENAINPKLIVSFVGLVVPLSTFFRGAAQPGGPPVRAGSRGAAPEKI
jgi:hypothetical protein